MEKEEYAPIAKRLRKARKTKFRTMKLAAEALGEEYPTYSGNENGSSPASLDRLLKYARRFGVPIEWLIAGRGRGPREKGVEPTVSDRLYDAYVVASELPENAQERIIAFISGVASASSDGNQANLVID